MFDSFDHILVRAQLNELVLPGAMCKAIVQTKRLKD